MKTNKRIYVVIVLVSLLAIPNFANTTLNAVLIIADNYEDSELNNIAESVKRDLGTIGSFLNVLDKRNLYNVNKIVLKGKDATRQKVESTLMGLSSSADDILIVYFSGHGGMDSQGTFIVTREGEFVYRNTLENMLQNKSARLKILITDACSNNIEGIAAARSFRTTRSSMEGKYDEIYKKLFSDHKGFLSLSAASEGEYAWSDDDHGGYFTYYFVKEGLSKNPSENWTENFTSSRQKVIQMFNRMPSDQRNDLLSEGIESQTPKAYSLPVSLNGQPVDPPPPPPDKPDNPDLDLKPTSADIVIYNNTQSTIQYYVEVPSEDGEYIINEFDGYLSPSQSLELSQVSVFYFQSSNQEIGYVIDSGDYIFKSTKFGGIDLYPDDEAYDEEEYLPYSADELSVLMVGLWEYELSDESVYFEFYGDGTYEIFDYEEYVLEEGYWEVYEENLDGEVYYTLELESEDGYVDEFDMYTEDGYMIELLSLLDEGSEVEFLYAVD